MRRGSAACFLFALLGCSRRQPAPAGPPDVVILYAADLHGAVASPATGPGGLARRATLVDQARLSARAVVQVDAGDLAPSAGDEPGLADPIAREGRARLALRAYRRMGVDAITVGEQDLALGAARWRALCAEAKVPVVAANLIGQDGQPLFPATRLVDAGQVKVGVFGILELGPQPGSPPVAVTITDASAAARAAVQSLRAQGARVIVGLFHLAGGLARATEIAAAAGGVDLVVLGHAGPSAPPRFVRAGARGVDVGRIDLHLARGGAARLDDQVLTASPQLEEQLGVRLLVRVAAGPIATTLAESVAAIARATGHRPFGEDWTYGSTALCAGCHPTQTAQWNTTDHAHAFATLEKAGKSHDLACMGCHLTGFLMPGGAQNLESASQFLNVGCEACHGPSVPHVVSTDKRRGTSRTVSPTVCLSCHTPDQNVGPFDVAAAMKEIVGPGHGQATAPPG